MTSPPSTPLPSLAILKDAILESGLVTEQDLAGQIAANNDDPQQLITKGLLTRFQLDALIAGRGASLRIGNYDILDRLGAGGMGTVFKARHRRMKRIVALKVLAANLSENPLFVKRFQREVETIAALGHPNVVMAYDADEADVGHFLVMEFVSGSDLAACVERTGPFSVAAAVDAILQSAKGLAYAHTQGIIHRDIKPHNLLRDQNGIIKVTDLGLARLNHGHDGPADGAEVTMAGGAIGTVDYMPPEQAVDATTIDHRADIYSLGCTLYYLLAGKPPYAGATLVSILLKHRDGEIPSLQALRNDVPEALDSLFRRMLAKTPEQRVQQMEEVVSELTAIASTLGPATANPLMTTSTVDMPGGIAALASSTVAASSPTELTLPTQTSAGGALTALIVEPSRFQASIIRGYFQEHAVEVIGTAANGADAIQAVHSLHPKVVISAMHLPDTDGIELARQIRAQITTNAPGFVLITSDSEGGETSSQSKLSRVLQLAKPFSAEQLMEAVKFVSGASLSLEGEFTLGPAATKKARGDLRVLIADDSGVARIHVRNILQSLGFSQFLEVPDGAHAIAIAAQESCDLIVTDYNMPLMNGRALVSYLKQNPATAAIPILMVTTETDASVLDPVRQLGVTAIFEKAFPASAVGPLLDSLFG